MNRESIDRWCERGILGLVLAVLVFGPLALGAVRVQEFLVVQALTLGVLVVWLVRLWVSARPQFLWPPICWAVLAFAGYALGRYLTCEVEYVGRQELLRVLVYTVIFFAILNNLHSQEYTQVINYTLIFLGMAISFYAVYQFLTGSGKVWHYDLSYRGRGSGTYISPNHLAGFLEMLVPVALSYTIAGRSKPLMKIFLCYAALVLLAGVAVTVSRGSWVACGVALLALGLVLVSHRSFRLPAAALLGFLLLCGIVAGTRMPAITARVTKGIIAGRLDLDTRYQMWNAAMEMWRDHTWFGGGPGHYELRFRVYRPPTLQLNPERAHNDYANLLADWGVAGAVLVLTALGLLSHGVAKTWGNVRRGDSEFSSNLSNKFAFVLGGSLGLLALVVHSAVDFNLQIPANALLAVSLMAMLSGHWRFATERFWFSLKMPGCVAVTAVFAVAIAYLGWQEVRLGREALWLHRAAALEADSPEQTALLEKAYIVEPRNFDTAYRLGEALRVESFEGRGDYRDLAAQAIGWYQRGVTNNPLNGYNFMRWGMTLDFLERYAEAEPLFMRADELDPNGYYTSAHVGKHYFDAGQYAAARPWLERSLLLFRTNDIAATHLRLANERLLEAASGDTNRALRELIREKLKE
jgi:O-antigen ligase